MSSGVEKEEYIYFNCASSYTIFFLNVLNDNRSYFEKRATLSVEDELA